MLSIHKRKNWFDTSNISQWLFPQQLITKMTPFILLYLNRFSFVKHKYPPTHHPVRNTLISDYAPIHLMLYLAASLSECYSWRLNEPFVQDPALRTDVDGVLQTCLSVSCTNSTNPLFVWEAHKCEIWGVLIKHGAQVKTGYVTKQLTLLRTVYQNPHTIHSWLKLITHRWWMFLGNLKAYCFQKWNPRWDVLHLGWYFLLFILYCCVIVQVGEPLGCWHVERHTSNFV